MLDGELYCHGVNLQTINSWVKKNRPESMQIKLHLYDMPEVPGMEVPIQKDRIEALEKFFAEKLSNLDHVVPGAIPHRQQRRGSGLLECHLNHKLAD